MIFYYYSNFNNPAIKKTKEYIESLKIRENLVITKNGVLDLSSFFIYKLKGPFKKFEHRRKYEKLTKEERESENRSKEKFDYIAQKIIKGEEIN